MTRIKKINRVTDENIHRGTTNGVILSLNIDHCRRSRRAIWSVRMAKSSFRRPAPMSNESMSTLSRTLTTLFGSPRLKISTKFAHVPCRPVGACGNRLSDNQSGSHRRPRCGRSVCVFVRSIQSICANDNCETRLMLLFFDLGGRASGELS